MPSIIFAEMPKLVPTTIKTMLMKNTKPIHERLGVRGSSERGSICESVHTSQMNILHPTISKAKNRRSVQDRLSKAWVNPATKERNRIALHALETMVNDKSHNMLIESDKDATELLTAFAQAIKRAKQPAIESADQKYDMKLQKEISMLQVSYCLCECPQFCRQTCKLYGVMSLLMLSGKTRSIHVPRWFRGQQQWSRNRWTSVIPCNRHVDESTICIKQIAIFIHHGRSENSLHLFSFFSNLKEYAIHKKICQIDL